MTTNFVAGWAVDSVTGAKLTGIGASVPAGAFILGGGAYTSLGSRYCKDVTGSSVPAGAFPLGKLMHTQDGAVYVKTTAPSPAYMAGPFTLHGDGALYVKPAGAQVHFRSGFAFDSDGGLVGTIA